MLSNSLTYKGFRLVLEGEKKKLLYVKFKSF